MKKNKICKCFISLGLLLFFTLLIPFTSYDFTIAKAASIKKEATDSYRLNVKSVTLVKGKSYTLKVYNLGANSKVSFKSDDAEVASVGDDGTITANKVGQAVITVTIKDGSTKTPLTCDVTVGPAAISVKWTKEKIFIGVNNEEILKVIIKPDNSTETARFSSYDPSIASVSSGGRLSAKKLGMTYLFAGIDAANPDGTRKYDICTVFVTNPADTPLLEAYFNDHAELNRIPYSELLSALEKFFNGDGASSVAAADSSESSLIKNLNTYLENEFKLSEIRAQMKAEAETTLSNSASTDANSGSQTK
jgi:hypothetical protein